MQIYKTVNSDDLKADIERLKQEARCTRDLLDWFKYHLPALGMNHEENPDEVRVTGALHFHGCLEKEPSENPSVEAEITIAVVNNTERHPHIDKLFNVNGDAQSSHTNKFTFELHFDEWPFLAADLAHDILLYGTGHLSDIIVARAETLLGTYLTKHFPGMTWETLKTMREVGLLFSNASTADTQQYQDMLFNTRKAFNTNVHPLPDALEPSP